MPKISVIERVNFTDQKYSIFSVEKSAKLMISYMQGECDMACKYFEIARANNRGGRLGLLTFSTGRQRWIARILLFF